MERWFEDSGNVGLAGRELPPAQVLAADQRITYWATELRKAGLEGDLDQLRARALLDIMLGVDSRPPAHGRDADRGGPHGQETDGRDGDGCGGVPGGDGDGCGGPDPDGPPGPRFPAPAGPLAGIIPPGFAGRTNLTVPLTTLTRFADRPGIGPIDPDPGANTRSLPNQGIS